MEAFDDIAESWDSFRRKPFPPIVEVVAKEWHGRILDVGCGNARNLLAFDGELFGIDSSKAMIDSARSNAAKSHKKVVFLVTDMTKLPFKDGYFDHVICVAALHHLDKENQLIALQEMKRVLKPGGKLLLTVWNKWQKKFFFGKRERMVPWTTKGRTIERYYFFHDMFSLKNLVLRAGFVIDSSKGMFGRNVVLILKKS
jgi:alkylated DNA repair protein alkB family protein 8